MICTHLIFCGFTERKGWFWKGKLVPLSPQYFRIFQPRVFSIIPYVYTEWDAFYNTVVVVTACTNRRRSQQSPRQLCHLLLGKKRVASCSFVERCKRICCPSLQGKGAGLDVFYHIPHLSSWCIISRTILQFKNPCLIHLTCYPPDRNSNTIASLPRWPECDSMYESQRPWHVCSVLMFPNGNHRGPKWSLSSKQERKILSFRVFRGFSCFLVTLCLLLVAQKINNSKEKKKTRKKLINIKRWQFGFGEA